MYEKHETKKMKLNRFKKKGHNILFYFFLFIICVLNFSNII